MPVNLRAAPRWSNQRCAPVNMNRPRCKFTQHLCGSQRLGRSALLGESTVFRGAAFPLLARSTFSKAGPIMRMPCNGRLPATMKESPTPTRGTRLVVVLKAGASYFGLVFAAGVVLGVVRVLWALPRYGERTAELLEAPVMLAAIVAAAWWITRRFASAFSPMQRFGTGMVALGLLIAVEFWFVFLLEELTLAQYFGSRDVVAALVYMALVGLFAAMPTLIPPRHGVANG
jgi:hypothetical protein